MKIDYVVAIEALAKGRAPPLAKKMSPTGAQSGQARKPEHLQRILAQTQDIRKVTGGGRDEGAK